MTKRSVADSDFKLHQSQFGGDMLLASDCDLINDGQSESMWSYHGKPKDQEIITHLEAVNNLNNIVVNSLPM